MFFVELYCKELLEERCKAERLDAEQLRGNPGVEDVIDVPAVVLMQQAEIVISIVKDDFDLWILENVAERFGHPDRERIYYRASFARGYLEEINSVDEPVEARALGINRDLPDAGHVSEKVIRVPLLVDVQQLL
jgi:hypothetical protein